MTVSLVGFGVIISLFISSCTFLYRVPFFREKYFSTKNGALGAFHRSAFIGTRLDRICSAISLLLAFFVIFA
jgi:hypothetical protein